MKRKNKTVLQIHLLASLTLIRQGRMRLTNFAKLVYSEAATGGYKKAATKNFLIFIGKHLCWRLKLQAFRS